jgi:GPH family glycoside/pentoside/hexuronide:cation symporter
MTSHFSSKRLGVVERIGYGLGDMACNVVLQMLMTFLAFFYTDVFGLSAAAMGTLMLVVRVATSLADPIAGALCDRTWTRWGKFRPYLIWFSISFAAAAVATFTTPNLSAGGKLVYAYCTYTLLMIIYSAINVPYCALGAVITTDSRERISLNGYRFFLATAGGALVTATTLPLVQLLGRGNDRLGFPLAVAVLTFLATFMLWGCFLLTKERVEPLSTEKPNVWTDLTLLIKNDQWRVIAAMNFVLFIALVIQDGTAVYYVTWYLGRPELVGPFITTGMVSSMAGALCASSLVGRSSKIAAYSILQGIIVIMSIAIYCVGPAQLMLLFLLYAVQQFFTQMASPILWSMMADTADYGELITGRRITGLTFSGALLALKLGAALGGASLGWLLACFNYQSQATSQSVDTVNGIVLLFTLFPAFGHLILILLASRYRLNTERCNDIIRALELRKGTTSDKCT